MKKINYSYRVPGPRSAPTGYLESKPVKPSTHQVPNPTKFYPELELDATGSIFWTQIWTRRVHTGSGYQEFLLAPNDNYKYGA